MWKILILNIHGQPERSITFQISISNIIIYITFLVVYFVIGYSGNGTICLDVNECQPQSGAEVTHNCDSNAACNNTEGSFTCVCMDGYSGDGVKCNGMEFPLNLHS